MLYSVHPHQQRIPVVETNDQQVISCTQCPHLQSTQSPTNGAQDGKLRNRELAKLVKEHFGWTVSPDSDAGPDTSEAGAAQSATEDTADGPWVSDEIAEGCFRAVVRACRGYRGVFIRVLIEAFPEREDIAEGDDDKGVEDEGA
jgi:hypothetical protein